MSSIPYIDNYRFGEIVIDGQPYSKDVIIFPDRVQGGWWREVGHLLQPVDLTDVLEAKPQVLVVGQGAYGRMDVAPETEQTLHAAHIELIVLPTGQACQTYNELREQGHAIAALHLTC